MKVIIAGSRTIQLYSLIPQAVKDSGFVISEVVCGCARGVDSLGEAWAIKNNVPVKRMPAEWDKHGKRAGFLRNLQMAEYADALILIWDGKSAGSKGMKSIAKSNGLEIYERIV